MTDFAVADLPSTTIDTDPGPSASGGGVVAAPVVEAPAEPASLRSDLEAVFKEDGDKPEAKDEKPEPAMADAKPEPKEARAAADEGDDAPKPEAKGEPAKDASAEEKPDEKDGGTKFHEPPKTFLPDSKDVWRNVPRSVRRDIDTMVREHEEVVARTQQDVASYDRLRDYDQLARTNGRDLRESLERVNQVENLMARNPIAGLNAILMEIGPRKADGQPVSLYEVAQHIVEQGPQGYQQMMAQAQQQAQPQQQPQNPEVQQLRQQLAQMQEDQLKATVLEPFKAKHPRFDELKDDIAFFLKSGKVPASLSHIERLAAAYDMAERINPSSRAAPAPTANDDAGPGNDRRADRDDLSGSKSIKSSPGSVTEEVEDQASSTESTRESLLKEMRRMNRA